MDILQETKSPFSAPSSSPSSASSAPKPQTQDAFSGEKKASRPIKLSENKSTFFQLSAKAGKKDAGLPCLSEELLESIGVHLSNKELIQLAKVNRDTYRALYPLIKAAMVKTLKKLVKNDDTVRVRELLQANPNLLLREDYWDPKGRAYLGLETTPYQDALADPFLEEMRSLLEESFPVTEQEEKAGETEVTRKKLEQAALQAAEFKDSRFNPYRQEQDKIMWQTQFAYETYFQSYLAWDGSPATVQPLRDAWLRVGLVQDRWSKRLRKIFSVVDMDEKQNFENLARDLPEPHFYNAPNDRWVPSTERKGCNLRLMAVDETQDLDRADFRTQLAVRSDGHSMLVRQGEGEGTHYYLYGPYIPLDRDESEWRLIPVDDPKVIQLIKKGRPAPGQVGRAPNFTEQTFPYNALFSDLYEFGAEHSLYLGAGWTYSFSAYNRRSRELALGGVRPCWCAEKEAWLVARLNILAVLALHKKRAENLAKHLHDLERYLPLSSLMVKLSLG